MTTAAQAAQRQIARFEERYANPKEVYGIPYGFPTLDKMTGGIQTKRTSGSHDFAVLVGNSGTGKSSLAGQISVGVAEWFKENSINREVRVVTLEMDPEQWQNRVIASRSGIPLHRIDTGMFLDSKQRDAYLSWAEYMATLPIRYVESPANMETLASSISKTQEEMRCGFFVVDHFNICPGASGDPNAMKQIADDLRRLTRNVAPSLVLAQMNRAALNREDKHPRTTDILYGNDLVQAADIILGLYRESMYTRVPAEMQAQVDAAEIELLKNRKRGKTGFIECLFYTDRGVWEEHDTNSG